MPCCSDPHGLELQEWTQVQEVVDRYEEAASDAEIDLEDFLPPNGDRLRPAILEEILKVDLEIRGRRGDSPSLNAHTAHLEELRALGRLSPELVYEEYRVRHMYGDTATLSDFEQRFPEQYPALQEIVRKRPLPSRAPRRSGKPAKTAGRGMTVESGDVLPVGGGFRLTARLGSGCSGEVWRAEGPSGFEVAVKIIFRPMAHADAQRELQALELIKRLRHPFLLQIQNYWQLADRLIIVMDLADCSLPERQRECRQGGLPNVPVAELLLYVREAAEALDYLHAENVLHRDVKPDNLVLLKRHAKLTDFGLASLHSGRQSPRSHGSGTPAYMAPEVFWHGQVSERSDQYSLAVTYVELRLGRPMFRSQATMDILRDHLQTTPILDPLGPEEQQVLLRALDKEPDNRFRSCHDFVVALTEAVRLNSPEGGIPAQTAADLKLARSLHFQAAWFWSCFVATVALALLLFRHFDPRPTTAASVFKEPNSASAEAIASQSIPNHIAPAVLEIEAGPPIMPPIPRKDGIPSALRPWSGTELIRVEGRPFAKRMVFPLPEAPPIDFVLIPGTAPRDPAAFYIMEDKVWVGLFRQFAAAHPEHVRSTTWKEQQDDLRPVMGITQGEADDFARWLGGKLPTAQQWDKAAGRFEPNAGKGPFLASASGRRPRVAVNRDEEGPRRVGDAEDDVSPFGCRDMAGNGLEWTRDISEGRPGDVVLRGQSFLMTRPLSFSDLAVPKKSPGAIASPYIGFRVVIEIED